MTTFALLNGTQFLAKTQLDSTKPQWSHCFSGINLGPLNLGKVRFLAKGPELSSSSYFWTPLVP